MLRPLLGCFQTSSLPERHHSEAQMQTPAIPRTFESSASCHAVLINLFQFALQHDYICSRTTHNAIHITQYILLICNMSALMCVHVVSMANKCAYCFCTACLLSLFSFPLLLHTLPFSLKVLGSACTRCYTICIILGSAAAFCHPFRVSGG